MFFVLVLCLHLCFGKASSIEEEDNPTSSSSSSLNMSRSGTGAALSSVLTMEQESGSGVVDRVASAAGGAVVPSLSARLMTSSNVFHSVDASPATIEMQMEMCQEQTMQLQEHTMQLQEHTMQLQVHTFCKCCS